MTPDALRRRTSAGIHGEEAHQVQGEPALSEVHKSQSAQSAVGSQPSAVALEGASETPYGEKSPSKVLRAAGVGLWEWHLVSDQGYWSPEAWELYAPGGSGAVSLKLWESALHPDDRERATANALAAIESGSDYQDRYRVGSADGPIRWLQSLGRVETEADGTRIVRGLVLDITQLVTTEEALRRSEAKLQFGIAIAGLGLGDIDYDTDTITLDTVAAALFDLPANVALARKSVHARFHPADAEAIAAKIREAQDPASSGYLDIEHRIVSTSGVEIWLSARKQITFHSAADGTKRATSGLLAVMDISEHKQAESALQASEAKFRGTFENTAVGIAHVGLDGRWLEINQRLCDIVGYSREELLKKTFRDITYPGDLEAGFAQTPRLLAGEIPSFTMDKRYIRKDGSVVWAGLTVSLRSDPAGRPVHFISIVRDISARINAVEALRENQAWLMQAADAAKVTHVVTDWVGNNVRSAANYAKVMGFSLPMKGGVAQRDEGIAVYLRHVVDEDRERVGALIHTFEPSQRFEYSLRGDDGVERHMEALRTTEFSSDGKPLRTFSTNLDITERKRAEQHNQLLMHEVTHRSKNHLAVVQSIARQTVRTSAPNEFEENLNARLLGLAHSQDLIIKGDWQSVSVSDLIQSQLAHLGGIKSSRVHCSGDTVRLLPPAAQGIGMALHELATNAIKYGAFSNETGTVTITWSLAGAESGRRFHIGWVEEGGPQVVEPNRRGFGRTVLERVSAKAVNGGVTLTYDPGGVRWQLNAPADQSLVR